MSFSGMIKEELSEHYAKARHCNLAELSALVRMSGEFAEDKRADALSAFIRKILQLQENALHYCKKHLI